MRFSPWRFGIFLSLGLILVLAAAPSARATVADDFEDGDDTSPAWTHTAPVVNANCVGAGNPFSCCTGAGTGTCATTYDASSFDYAISVIATGTGLNPPRALSGREQESFGDVVVFADLLDWDEIPDHAYGIGARATASAAPTRDGYALVYIRNAFFPTGSQIRLVQFDNEVPTTLAHTLVSLNTSNDYRLVLTIKGTNPAVLTGRVFDKSDPATPLATVTYTDSTAPIYTDGFAGFVVADLSGSGSQNLSGTFDNFFGSDPDVDTDGDGVSDGNEAAAGTNPEDSDTDDDGLLDGDEIWTGTFGGQTVISNAANGATSVFAADVDGDGDLDVLSASDNDDKIAWYENDGMTPPGWTARTISTAAIGAFSVFAADVDGDGDVDALSASFSDSKIAWYENDGMTPPGWTAHTISTAADGALSVFAADVDGDGDTDALSASRLDSKIAWYENDGMTPPGWTARTISTAASFAESVFAADVDGDGDVDALSASRADNKIAWYENDGMTPPGWTARTISTAANQPFSVFAADVDGDGDVDALSASFSDSKIAWYENDGMTPPGWTAHTISTAANAATSVFAADVDGDGDVDVLSASLNDDKIAWYEQLNVADPLDPDTDDDGLLDGVETNTGTFVSPSDTGTDPLDSDTDNDFYTDGAEVTGGSDPNDPFDFPGEIVPALSLPGMALFLLLLLAGGMVRRRKSRGAGATAD